MMTAINEDNLFGVIIKGSLGLLAASDPVRLCVYSQPEPAWESWLAAWLQLLTFCGCATCCSASWACCRPDRALRPDEVYCAHQHNRAVSVSADHFRMVLSGGIADGTVHDCSQHNRTFNIRRATRRRLAPWFTHLLFLEFFRKLAGPIAHYRSQRRRHNLHLADHYPPAGAFAFWPPLLSSRYRAACRISWKRLSAALRT